MGQIKVNSGEFERIAASFQSAAENSIKIHSRIKNATDNLLSNWQGNSKKAYSKEFEKLFKNMDSYKEILEGIAKDIKEVAQRFKETDTSLKDNFNK